jgi:hypothetical protein
MLWGNRGRRRPPFRYCAVLRAFLAIQIMPNANKAAKLKQVRLNKKNKTDGERAKMTSCS